MRQSRIPEGSALFPELVRATSSSLCLLLGVSGEAGQVQWAMLTACPLFLAAGENCHPCHSGP